MEKNDAISRIGLLEDLGASCYDLNALTGITGDERTLQEAILQFPALDVAPVVRCNMCKYYEQDTGFCQYLGCGNDWDGYCNKGARMDGDAK